MEIIVLRNLHIVSCINSSDNPRQCMFVLCLQIQEFGVNSIRDLKPDGRNTIVTEETKYEYVKLVCQMKMTGAIRQQLSAFLEGFYDIVPKKLISIFNEQELELLISGLPTIDIDDLKANSEYHKYQPTSLQVWVSVVVSYTAMSLIARKPVFRVSDQVPHKPGCTKDG